MVGSAAMHVAVLLAALAAADVPREAQVAVDSLLVLDQADDAAVATDRLAKGTLVTIVRDRQEGWVAIRPPAGAFSLVESSDVEEIDEGHARVVSRYAKLRRGLEGAKMPGPPHLSLREGTTVRLLNRRPLVVRQSGETRTWLPIVPPKDEVRYVREEDLVVVAKDDESEKSPPRKRGGLVSEITIPPPIARAKTPRRQSPHQEIASVDPRLGSVEQDVDESSFSPEFASVFGKVTARHRDALRSSLGAWELDKVRDEYQSLLGRASSAAERSAVQGRLTLIDRQAGASSASRTMEQLIQKSRDRDAGTSNSSLRNSLLSREKTPAYDMTGLLQTSSKMHDGQRVYVLISERGGLAAYLAIPPGLSVRELISHRVGVYGDLRYDDDLRTTLILVREIEPLINKP